VDAQRARRLMLNRVEATQVTGADRIEVGGATVLIHPGLPANSWNFVVDVDSTDSEFVALTRRIEEEFRKHKRWPAWLTGPYDRPVDMEERLRSLDYGMDPDRTVMWIDKPPKIPVEAPDGLEIERADDGTVDECVQIALQRFGWSYEWGKHLRNGALAGIARGPGHYRMYYAALNGAGVGTSFTVFSGGTAGFYGMATSKENEGQGIGRALLKRSIDEAFAEGVDEVTIQVATGSKAEAFYTKAGFKKAYVAHKVVKKSGGAPERPR